MNYIIGAILSIFLLGSCIAKKNEVIANEDVFYTCSMDPQVKENKPGKCPICKMELKSN